MESEGPRSETAPGTSRVFDFADESMPASPREFTIPVFDFNCKEHKQLFYANKV